MKTCQHWAKNRWIRHTTLYDASLVDVDALDLRYSPGFISVKEVPVLELKRMFLHRPARFVSHAPSGPVYVKTDRLMRPWRQDSWTVNALRNRVRYLAGIDLASGPDRISYFFPNLPAPEGL